MTANSPAPSKRLLRWASMESLGFYDTPTSATVTTYASQTDQAPTTLTVRPIPPTGDLVKDLWDSTELDAPSLLDWSPTVRDRRRLRGRDFRWTRVVSSMLLVLVVGLGAAWLALRPAENAETSVALVSDRAAALESALTGLAEVGEQVSADPTPTGENAAALFAVDEAARGLFDASGALPPSQADTRDAASDVAGLSLDAARRVRDALALRGVVESLVVPPVLESDPAMTDLGGATLAFTEWRAGFEVASEAIPEGLSADVAAAVDSFAGALDQIQAKYADAIRLNDSPGARSAVAELETGLGAIRESMMSAVAESTASLESDLARAQYLIEHLLG